MKITISIIIIIVLIFLGFILFNNDSEDNNTQNQEETSEENNTEKVKESNLDKAPDFTLEDINGNSVSLTDFVGKTLVINAWATWCPFCVDELPDFVNLQEEFGDKIVMIAINRQESLNKSKKFTDNLGVTADMLWLLDPKDSFYKSIGGFSMPETIFVNSDGEIVIHKRGPMELDEMISRVNQTIGE